MNDNAKILDQNPGPITPVQPVAPVGIANKEMGPIPSVVPEIRPSGPEAGHNIDQSSTELGVKEVQDRPSLTSEHKEIGLEHSGATAPVPTGPTGLVQIPQTKDIESSSTWLNAVIEKVRKLGKLLGV